MLLTPILAVERYSEKSFAPLEVLDLCVYFVLRLFCLCGFFKLCLVRFFPLWGGLL